MIVRSTNEPVPAATGREKGACFIFGEGRAWSEASWPGAGPILRAKCLEAITTDSRSKNN